MIDDIQLITEIKNHPLLYDPGVPENRDINAKESTWEFIAKSLGYSVRECKVRWKSLRERFARERKKIVMKDDECTSDNEHDLANKGPWPLMKHMHFLWNFVIHRNLNRSRALDMDASQEDHSVAMSSMSNPVWLLPNINNNLLLQALQPKSATHVDEQEEFRVIEAEKVKDPLCDDEDDGSVCFNVDTSDSERRTPVSKRHLDENSRLEVESTSLKRNRREDSAQPSSSGLQASNPEISKSSDTHSRGHGVENRTEKSAGSVYTIPHEETSSDVYRTFGENKVHSIGLKYENKLNTSTPVPQKLNLSVSKTDDELFCMSIAASMQRLTPKQRALLKLRIQQVLYEVEFPD